jgi:hypothetical protein
MARRREEDSFALRAGVVREESWYSEASVEQEMHTA